MCVKCAIKFKARLLPEAEEGERVSPSFVRVLLKVGILKLKMPQETTCSENLVKSEWKCHTFDNTLLKSLDVWIPNKHFSRNHS